MSLEADLVVSTTRSAKNSCDIIQQKGQYILKLNKKDSLAIDSVEAQNQVISTINGIAASTEELVNCINNAVNPEGNNYTFIYILLFAARDVRKEAMNVLKMARAYLQEPKSKPRDAFCSSVRGLISSVESILNVINSTLDMFKYFNAKEKEFNLPSSPSTSKAFKTLESDMKHIKTVITKKQQRAFPEAAVKLALSMETVVASISKSTEDASWNKAILRKSCAVCKQ